MADNNHPEPMFHRILFCTDFSENADHAFKHAIDMVSRRPGCELHILHVIPEPEGQFWKTYIYELDGVDEKAKADIDAAIQEHYLARVPDGAHVTVEIRIGKDYAEILEYAETAAVDLIIMGRQGSSSLGTVLFGNVTEKLARHAHCAVLIIPRLPEGEES